MVETKIRQEVMEIIENFFKNNILTDESMMKYYEGNPDSLRKNIFKHNSFVDSINLDLYINKEQFPFENLKDELLICVPEIYLTLIREIKRLIRTGNAYHNIKNFNEELQNIEDLLKKQINKYLNLNSIIFLNLNGYWSVRLDLTDQSDEFKNNKEFLNIISTL